MDNDLEIIIKNEIEKPKLKNRDVDHVVYAWLPDQQKVKIEHGKEVHFFLKPAYHCLDIEVIAPDPDWLQYYCAKVDPPTGHPLSLNSDLSANTWKLNITRKDIDGPPRPETVNVTIGDNKPGK